MKAGTIIRASMVALAAGLVPAGPASASVTLLLAAGGGGGGGSPHGADGGAGQTTKSGQAGAGISGGAGGVNGMGGAGGGPFDSGGGGAGWLGSGGAGEGYDSGGGGLSSPTFAGGVAPYPPVGGAGGFGGGGGGGVGGGGGGGYSGGGGGSYDGGGGGGGSYINSAFANAVTEAGANGNDGFSPSIGSVEINSAVISWTGATVYYTVPATGVYDIVAYGAQGGVSLLTVGGYGTEVGGQITLDEGTVLAILAGGAGLPGGGGGGGGGSFVWETSAVIPEPSTWAMTLAGFAGLGFAGYRATRKSTVLPA